MANQRIERMRIRRRRNPGRMVRLHETHPMILPLGLLVLLGGLIGMSSGGIETPSTELLHYFLRIMILPQVAMTALIARMCR